MGIYAHVFVRLWVVIVTDRTNGATIMVRMNLSLLSLSLRLSVAVKTHLRQSNHRSCWTALRWKPAICRLRDSASATDCSPVPPASSRCSASSPAHSPPWPPHTPPDTAESYPRRRPPAVGSVAKRAAIWPPHRRAGIRPGRWARTQRRGRTRGGRRRVGRAEPRSRSGSAAGTG